MLLSCVTGALFAVTSSTEVLHGQRGQTAVHPAGISPALEVLSPLPAQCTLQCSRCWLGWFKVPNKLTMLIAGGGIESECVLLQQINRHVSFQNYSVVPSCYVAAVAGCKMAANWPSERSLPLLDSLLCGEQ